MGGACQKKRRGLRTYPKQRVGETFPNLPGVHFTPFHFVIFLFFAAAGSTSSTGKPRARGKEKAEPDPEEVDGHNSAKLSGGNYVV